MNRPRTRKIIILQASLVLLLITLGGGSVRDSSAETINNVCRIPAGHQHVRYGKAYLESTTNPGRFYYRWPSQYLAVCSGGRLTCVISTRYLQTPAWVYYIVGNDLDNTITPAGTASGDRARACRDANNRRIIVSGWDSRWLISLALFGGAGNDWLIGGPRNDYLYGGSGNDMMLGKGGDNFLYGQNGRDVMHGGKNGFCDGGAPNADSNCYTEGNWPYNGTAGDCCCSSCFRNSSCYYSDITPGVTDPIPVPW